MAATPILGEDFEVYVLDVGQSPPVYVPVDDMNSFSRATSRDQQTFPVFMRAQAHIIPGARTVTGTISGLLDTDSEGQAILFAAEKSGDTVGIKVLWDGTNGYTQDVKIGSTSINATPEGFQEVSFDLLAQDDPQIEGTGPLP